MAGNPISPWWPISFGVAALVFFIAGGALLGTWAGCYWDYCSDASYYGGIALIVVGFFFKIAWIVTLVIYIRRRRYGYRGTIANPNSKAHWNAGTGLLENQNYSSQPPAPAQYVFAPPGQTQYSAVPVAAPTYDPMPVKDHVTYAAVETPRPNAPGGVRYCLQCGAVVHTPYCANCGCANPM